MGIIEFQLSAGEKVVAESGSMAYMDGNIDTNTRTRSGGLLKTLKSAALGGASFFVNEFTAQEDGCMLGITGQALGDIVGLQADEEYLIQSGAYVCNTGSLTLDTKWQGFTKGLFGSEVFMLKTEGTGMVFMNALGGIIKKQVDAGKTLVVDNYQLVAFPARCDYNIRKHGSMKTTILGGEALVVEITGPGDVYIQTKNIMEFARSLDPFLSRRR